MGSFSVMRPPPRPTADNSRPVVDPTLKAKILAAREILGKDTVNDEDLWELERQGRFASLALPGDAPARTTAPRTLARPPAMPDPGLPTVGPPVPTGVTPPPTVTAPQTPSQPPAK